MVEPVTVKAPVALVAFISTNVPVPFVTSLLILKFVVDNVNPELKVNFPPAFTFKVDAVALAATVTKCPFKMFIEAADDVGAAVAAIQNELLAEDSQVDASLQLPEVFDLK